MPTVTDKNKAKKYADVVGLEIGETVSYAVRIARTPLKIEIVSVAELPGVHIPTTEDEVVKNASSLILPRQVAAPYAAMAVNASSAIMRLVVLKKTPEEDPESALTELFGTSRLADYRIGFVETTEPPAEQETPPSESGDASKNNAPEKDRMYIACALPNYIAANVAKILPEAKHPAPASLQLASAARLAAFARGPVRRDSTALLAHLHVGENQSTVAVFSRGALVAYRQFPMGNAAVMSRVAQEFGLSEELAIEMLNENQIDPSTATGPVLTILFRQVALSTEFVARREKSVLSGLFISGVTTGIIHWLKIAETTMQIPVEHWMPFDDFPVRSRAIPRTMHVPQEKFTVALGAAIALSEDPEA